MSVFDKHEYHIINTSNWKKFKISDLFNVVLAKGDIKPNEVSAGNIPFISAGKNNNGVAAYISENGDGISKIFTGNKITIDMFGKSFYQEKDFFAASHGRVNILIPKFNMTKMTGLFICAIIDKHQNDFSYSNACYSKQAKEMIIILPVISDGSPNWQYMESYMQNLWNKIEITFKKENNNNRIDTSKWKKFKISDLFEIKGSKTTKHNNLSQNKSEVNCYPYVTTAATNNGISGWSNFYTEKGNIITIDSAVLGKAFYQEYNFTASDHVEKLIPKFNMNKMIGCFIVTILDKTGKQIGYNYSKKRSQKALKEETILLPVTSDGSPDWKYMEDFMKDIEERSVLIQAIKNRG